MYIGVAPIHQSEVKAGNLKYQPQLNPAADDYQAQIRDPETEDSLI
jgi:hypothetical protein